MAVLITGASGFVGSALTKVLVDEKVVCLSCHKLKEEVPGIQFVQGDFHFFEDLRQLDRYQITIVFGE